MLKRRATGPVAPTMGFGENGNVGLPHPQPLSEQRGEILEMKGVRGGRPFDLFPALPAGRPALGKAGDVVGAGLGQNGEAEQGDTTT